MMILAMANRVLPRIVSLSVLAVLLIIGIAALSPQHSVYAAECGGVQTSIISGGVCDGADIKSTDSSSNPVTAIIKFVLQLLTGAVGLVAVGMIVYAGILYSSAGGNQGQVAKAKEYILNTIIGIVAYLGMLLILNWTIPGGVFGQQGVTGSGTQNSSTNNSSGSTNQGTSEVNKASTLQLSIGSWNVYIYNKQNAGTRVQSLLANDMDIVGVQEAGPQAKNLIKISCSSCSYGMYPTSGSPRKVAILWNKKKLTALSKGTVHASTLDGVKKYVVWVKFKDNTSGKIFYVLNTHFPFNAEENGKLKNTSGGRAYPKHMTSLVNTIKSFQKENLPIFVTGDINANYRLDKCSVSALPCRALSRNLNVKSGWEYLKLSGISGSTGTAGSDRIIDYVFSWKLDYITYRSMSIAHGGDSRNGWGGSDHKPIVLKLTIGAQK